MSDGLSGPKPPEANTATCERCGRPNSRVLMGEHRLCEDCCHLYGSCCMEFGADDLWAD